LEFSLASFIKRQTLAREMLCFLATPALANTISSWSLPDRGLSQTRCQNRQFAHLLRLNSTAEFGMINHPDLGMPDNVSKIDGLDFASCSERSAPEEPGARSSFRLCPAPFREATRDGIWTAAASQWSPKQTVFFANRQLV
jgi:hypothetical protein